MMVCLVCTEKGGSPVCTSLAQSVREFGRRWLDSPTKALLCMKNISEYCCKRECILNSVFKDKSFQVECIDLMTQTHLDFSC